MLSETSVIADTRVIPCTGHDSMLLSLSRTHSPLLTRSIMVITDNSDNTGAGEIYGGGDITKVLESYVPLAVGRVIGEYKGIVNYIRNNGYVSRGNNGQGFRRLDLSNLKSMVHTETAVECALLDLIGKLLNLPVCELLGDRQRGDKVVILGYLFYCQDHMRTDMKYLDEGDSDDKWFNLRYRTTMTTDRIAENTYVMKEKYGLKDFKLKGGILND